MITKPRKLIGLILITHHPRVWSLHLHFHRMFMICIKGSAKKIQESNAHYKFHVDLHCMHLEFNEGDYFMIRIWPKRFLSGTIKKLHTPSASPYKILKKINVNAYVIDLPSNFEISSIFNISDLVAYKGQLFNSDNPLVDLNEPTHERDPTCQHYPIWDSI